MAVTLPHPTLGTGVVNSTDLDENFSTLANALVNIDNSNVKNGAGLDINKLSASYEYVTVPLVYVNRSNAGMPTASTILAMTPMYNDAKGTWTAVTYAWHADDVGAQTGSFNIKWGFYQATGVITASPTLVKSAQTLSGGTANLPFNGGGSISVSLPWTQSAMILYVDVATQDATALGTLNDGATTDHSKLIVSVTLKRQIAT